VIARREVPERIVVSKELAATWQLETAIALWFYYGDPVSIHTLAAAAQGILAGVAGKKYKLSHMKVWVKQFPKDIQNKLRDPQNFFKHASTDAKVARTYQPFIGDTIIADAVILHQDLFGLTPYLRAFTIRLSFERPTIFSPDQLTKKVTQGIRISDLGNLDRPSFFRVVLGRLNAATVRTP
jgi:hypothetical protein